MCMCKVRKRKGQKAQKQKAESWQYLAALPIIMVALFLKTNKTERHHNISLYQQRNCANLASSETKLVCTYPLCVCVCSNQTGRTSDPLPAVRLLNENYNLSHWKMSFVEYHVKIEQPRCCFPHSVCFPCLVILLF